MKKVTGNSALSIVSKKSSNNGSAVSLSVSIISKHKGDSIELSGYLKLENVAGRAGLCLVLTGEKGILAANEMKADSLHGTHDWRKYTIKLPLTDLTRTIYLAVYQIGSGSVWADNFQLSIDNRPLSGPFMEIIPIGDTNRAPYISKFGKVIVNPALLEDRNSKVSAVPSAFKFNPFYKKYLNAGGIAIVASGQVSDQAFYKTREVTLMMLEKMPKIKEMLIKNNARIAIIGKDELTTDLPEYKDFDPYVNQRARGFGGNIAMPLTSGAEENILCLAGDRYQGEDILIHEFTHTIQVLGIEFLDKDFKNQLYTIYSKALIEGLWKNTYAISNPEEYFAEGVQSWYNVNKFSQRADGIHNEISSHSKLEKYDPRLYNLIKIFFPYEKLDVSCHQQQGPHYLNFVPWDSKP